MAKAPVVPVLAEKAPEPGEKPPEPTITIAEVKPPGMIHAAVELERSGDMKVDDYVPTAEDLANLAKASTVNPDMVAPPPPDEQVTAPSLIPASVAARTMAEMEAGRKIVEERTALRNKQLGIP